MSEKRSGEIKKCLTWGRIFDENRLINKLFCFFIMVTFLTLTGCKEKSDVVVPATDTRPDDQENTDSLTLASLTRIDDYPMYMMNYYGDYSVFDDISGGDGTSLSGDVPIQNENSIWGCTCFAAMGDTSFSYLGRNFDWNYCIPLVLYTNPPGRYASVSIVDLEYFGYNKDNLPDDWNKRENLLETFQLPFDGMNEKGVAVGMMAIPASVPPFDPLKKSVGELQILRLILDSAKNVGEAISIMQNYNIIMDGPPIHYMIADASRKSVIIEFIAGEMIVIPSTEMWQVCTNFIVTGSGAPHDVPCWRYNQAYTLLQETDGKVTNIASMEMLEVVSQANTIWSVVYRINTLSFDIAVGRDFNDIKTFSLK